MSNWVFPDLPLIAVDPDRERLDRTLVYENPGGTEQRVSLYASPRHRIKVKCYLRDTVAAPSPWNAYSELGVVSWFLDQHKGSWDSFLWDDPIGRKNLLSYSQDLSQSAWTKNTGVTVAANSVVAPDGTTTADSIVYNGTGVAGDFRIHHAGALSENGATYTASGWLRAASSVSVRFGCNFGYVTAALTTAWQRFTASGVGNGTSNAWAIVTSAVGDNTAWTVYGWGFQLEKASSAGLYVPTDATPVTGQIRVRFAEDSFRLRKIVDKVWLAEFDFITTVS